MSVGQAGFKSYLRFFLAPMVYAKQYRQNSWRNIRQFLRRDFHMDYSMKVLIETFYKAIQGNGPLPISYREILVTARIMDKIFESVPPSGVVGNRPLERPADAMAKT